MISCIKIIPCPLRILYQNVKKYSNPTSRRCWTHMGAVSSWSLELYLQMYRKSYCTTPSISVGRSGSIYLDKMVKFYVKVFMWWARHCQASYPVRGQVLFNLAALFLHEEAQISQWLITVSQAPVRHALTALCFRLQQGCHGQGKISGKWKFFQVREKSGNFVDGQGNLERTWKVREKSGNLKINGYGRLSSGNLFILSKRGSPSPSS